MRADKDLSMYKIGDMCYIFSSGYKTRYRSGKLYAKWVGPMQIVDTKRRVIMYFSSRIFVNGKVLEAHIDCMNLYSNRKMNVT